jgi:hypothetical protein
MPSTARRALPDRRAANAAKQKRYRERVRHCRASYHIDADDRVLSMLIRRRYIDEAEAADAGAVGEAITLLLADLAANDPLI